jgi:hypothetical protein
MTTVQMVVPMSIGQLVRVFLFFLIFCSKGFGDGSGSFFTQTAAMLLERDG